MAAERVSRDDSAYQGETQTVRFRHREGHESLVILLATLCLKTIPKAKKKKRKEERTISMTEMRNGESLEVGKACKAIF